MSDSSLVSSLLVWLVGGFTQNMRFLTLSFFTCQFRNLLLIINNQFRISIIIIVKDVV